MEIVKLAGKMCSTDQKAADKFQNSLLSFIQKTGNLEKQIFNTDDAGLFYNTVNEHI